MSVPPHSIPTHVSPPLHSFPSLSSDGPVVSVDLATGYVLDTLREGDDLKLVCDVDSNPPPTAIVWYHKVRGIKFLTECGDKVRFERFAGQSIGARCGRRHVDSLEHVDVEGAHAGPRGRVLVPGDQFGGGGPQPSDLGPHEMQVAFDPPNSSLPRSLLHAFSFTFSRRTEVQAGLREARGHSWSLRNGVAALRGRLGAQGRREVLVDVQRDAWRRVADAQLESSEQRAR